MKNLSQFLLALMLLLPIVGCDKSAEQNPVPVQNGGKSLERAVVTSNIIRKEIDRIWFVPCANGGAGEDVRLTGTLQVLTHTTTNGDNFQTKIEYNPQGVKGVGQITGDKYEGTGMTEFMIKGTFVNGQYTESDVNNFRIVGQGNGNNYLEQDHTQITINSNGEVKVDFYNESIDCK